ncbi:MAG TPA: glycosyltransferase, partial [Terriglobia bacterium]|nr:glycosyltransferase [Terriglobia bacterium]
ISKAAVYVIPLRVGGGTRLKVFEAMAMGKAIVSTSIGAEGLGLEDGVDIMLADNPAQFAGAVIELLCNEESRRKMAAAAIERVREYDWSKIAERFGQVLSDLIESGQRHSSPVPV